MEGVGDEWGHRRVAFGSQGLFSSVLLTGRPGCLEFPPPPAPPAASAATIATQIPVLRSQLHRSHNLGCPFLLPHHTAPPRRPAIAAHAPHPPQPERQQLFPLHARAQTHKHGTRAHRLVGTCLFSSSPFPFSHIIQFLPLLFTLRKIPWPHDPMKA